MIENTFGNDTIAAIATPAGHGGIGIVKISGPSALQIRNDLFQPSRRQLSPASHRLVHGIVRDSRDGHFVDEVLVSWMAAPYSYTGEDVVEINSHGGTIVTQRILDLVLNCGARMADPGEFTKRAFLNGRIDLTQAEAVVDLINSKTDLAARIAGRHLNGELRQRVEAVREALRDVYALIAAGIDFPEEIDDEGGDDRKHAASRLRQAVLTPIHVYVEHHRKGQVVREGARIAVVGKPNVGKSTLMNRLLDRERVIVSEIPGTTRDAVSDMTSIDGIPVTIVDTAGIRETADPIESIGIQKAREALEAADLVLFLVDAGKPLCSEDQVILASLDALDAILVRNKIDLTDNQHEPTVNGKTISFPGVSVSAKFGDGFDALKELIVSMLTHEPAGAETEQMMPNARQTKELLGCAECVSSAIDILERQAEDEFAAIELERAMAHINAVLGIAAPEDIIDSVFERFCIGK